MSKETAAFAATSPAETEWVTLLQDNTRAGGQGAPPIAPPSRARWQARIGGSIRSAPVLHGSTLYAASLLGKLHAIDVETGREKWNFAAPIGHEHFDILPDMLCFGKKLQEKVLFGCDDGKVYAVHQDSGTKLWEASTGGEVWASPVVRQGTAYFGSADGHLYAADARTGKLRWKQALGGRVYSTAYAAEKSIYVGCGDGHAHSLNAATGKMQWSVLTGNGIDSSPALVGGTLLFGSEDFFVYALDANSGAVLWKYETGLGISSSPAVADDVAYIGSKDGFLYALAVKTGELKWKTRAGEVITLVPPLEREAQSMARWCGQSERWRWTQRRENCSGAPGRVARFKERR